MPMRNSTVPACTSREAIAQPWPAGGRGSLSAGRRRGFRGRSRGRAGPARRVSIWAGVPRRKTSIGRRPPEHRGLGDEESRLLPRRQVAQEPQDLGEVLDDPGLALHWGGDELPGGVPVAIAIEGHAQELAALAPAVQGGDAHPQVSDDLVPVPQWADLPQGLLAIAAAARPQILPPRRGLGLLGRRSLASGVPCTGK